LPRHVRVDGGPPQLGVGAVAGGQSHVFAALRHGVGGVEEAGFVFGLALLPPRLADLVLRVRRQLDKYKNTWRRNDGW
jgi:hypothetical protein